MERKVRMEYIEVVDENGKHTGQIMEREKVHDLNLLHWEVAVMIVNHKGQTLLQKRSPNKRNNPNKWGVCAGHVDIGEALEQAALRELKEEVGIECNQNDLKLLAEKELRLGKNNSHFTRYYYVYCDKPELEFTLQKEELSEVKWVNIDELIEMVKNKREDLTIKEDRIYLLEKLKKIETS